MGDINLNPQLDDELYDWILSAPDMLMCVIEGLGFDFDGQQWARRDYDAHEVLNRWRERAISQRRQYEADKLREMNASAAPVKARPN